MASYLDLIRRYAPPVPPGLPGREPVHAAMAGFPGRTEALRRSVESLVPQVDALHVFLEGFDTIPGFLDRDNLFITRSQDFGNLGECGKYYWTDDLRGYQFICSDRMVYPAGYVTRMISDIEAHGRKKVIGAGGFLLEAPFVNFRESAVRLAETSALPADVPVPLLNDMAVAYHTSAIRMSRHFFYQPELSGLWLSITALEQNVPLVCCRHEAGWLEETGVPDDPDPEDYRSFLARCYFTAPEQVPDPAEAFDINRCFDRIFVLNLDRRPDRWEYVQRIARKHKLEITRFPATDGKSDEIRTAWEQYRETGILGLPAGIDPVTGYLEKFRNYRHYAARVHFFETWMGRKAMQSPGAFGVNHSYSRLLKTAIRQDYRRILVFEDDILLHRDFNEEFARIYRTLPPDWKLIMLGVMQHTWEPYITRFNELLYHCHGSSVGSHADGIDRKIFLPLLFYTEKMDIPIDDGAMFHVQNVYPRQCFVFLPNLAIQDMSESDISVSIVEMQDMERQMTRFRWNLKDYEMAPTPFEHTRAVYNTGAAEIIVPMLMEWFRPSSVADVGCGLGSWLAVFRSCGVKEVLGIDGEPVNRELTYISESDIEYRDLEQDFATGRRFDLALCLEVAEHLSPDSAGRFIKNLVAFSDVIVFSAAVPFQGGANHLNEQWTGYWKELFLREGYEMHDPVRPLIWDNDKIEWWYRQNMVVAVKKGTPLPFPASDRISDMVQPALFLKSARSLLDRNDASQKLFIDIDHLKKDKAYLQHENTGLRAQNANLTEKLEKIHGSVSWRIAHELVKLPAWVQSTARKVFKRL